MKIMFASDIHGSAYYCTKMKELYEKEKANRLILLGDLLYHGPRNDLPREYNPKEVIRILNDLKQEILCVRGNCDSEVDQMVLEFPILADYMTMFIQNRVLFITHGHLYNEENRTFLRQGDILIHGHTHIQKIQKYADYMHINPGSVSLPKNGNKNSYMILENTMFKIKDLEQNSIMQVDIRDI